MRKRIKTWWEHSQIPGLVDEAVITWLIYVVAITAVAFGVYHALRFLEIPIP